MTAFDNSTGFLRRAALSLAATAMLGAAVFAAAHPRSDDAGTDAVGVIDGDNMRRLAGLRRDGTPTSGGDLRTQVQAIYAAMRSAMQRSDWAAFGRAMDALSRITGGSARR